MTTQLRHSWTERMLGAAKLDTNIYEEVEADHTATGQAAGVIALVAIAQAIGASGHGTYGIIAGLAGAIFGWLLWAGITYLIGDKLLGGTATWGELLRTIGFAQAPGVLYVLGIIPLFGGLVRVALGIWILIAGIIAIRQALDFSTGKAILTAVLGWLAVAIPSAILGVLGAGLLSR
ncbi:MAG: YIP1 family protein [Pyrinomonadaceae bacterium]|nr:YIP1 family protein [Pyrinomonadaceae bacterium]